MQISNDVSKIAHWFDKSGFDALFTSDIKPYIEIHTFLPRESLSKEGSPLPYLFYLVSGKAKIYMTHENGRRSLVHFAVAPCFIGEMGLLEVEPYAKGIEAMETCVCLVLPLKACKPMLMTDPKFLKNLCISLGYKAIYRSESMAKSFAYPFENRFAAFILTTEENGIYHEKHTEVAEYLNVSYRHLLYTLQIFIANGWIEKKARHYILKDRDALQLLAQYIK